MSAVGTPENPLRVAVIGSGPSGFYAAEHLFRSLGDGVRVDMIERLPSPYGLVRGGVAPDHPKIKSVIKVYEKIAQREGFNFYGNVTFGKDITLADLRRHYHAAIFATGAQTDRSLGIPGEELLGSYAATEFVAWYNGHPDYRDRQFDLTAERAIVVGVGNVAMDVARILARGCDELMPTDITDYALAALDKSNIREIIIMGRRGPAQAAFTSPELKELGELAEADVIVAPEDATLDPLSEAWLQQTADRDTTKNIALLQGYSATPPKGKRRRIVLRFLASPVEIKGDGRVESVVVAHNELYQREDGSLAARPTGVTEEIPCGLIFRSVGYRGVPLPDMPFDERKGTIPNSEGRILSAAGGEPLTGLYVTGWIKRGPSGIIGTNKPDSVETVERLLADAQSGVLWSPEQAGIGAVLADAQTRVVSFKDWQRIDLQEIEDGQKVGRPRAKLTRIEDMLAVLD